MDLSSVMLNNLGVLLAHSDMILNNPDFSGLWLKPLKSGMMVGGGGTARYSLGALLKSWINSDELLTGDGIYMFKMGGSGLSGAGVYEGWSIEINKIVSGGITRFPQNTLGYFKIFVQLMKSSRFTRRSDLIVAREFFEKLGIEY